MSMKIEMGKEYRTKDGVLVRVLCTDAGNCGPVVALVGVEKALRTYEADGSYVKNKTSNFDLVPITDANPVYNWDMLFVHATGMYVRPKPTHEEQQDEN